MGDSFQKDTYYVTFNLKKKGALGVSWPKVFAIRAFDRETAVEEARTQAYFEGYEHLALSSVQKAKP